MFFLENILLKICNKNYKYQKILLNILNDLIKLINRILENIDEIKNRRKLENFEIVIYWHLILIKDYTEAFIKLWKNKNLRRVSLILLRPIFEGYANIFFINLDREKYSKLFINYETISKYYFLEKLKELKEFPETKEWKDIEEKYKLLEEEYKNLDKELEDIYEYTYKKQRGWINISVFERFEKFLKDFTNISYKLQSELLHCSPGATQIIFGDFNQYLLSYLYALIPLNKMLLDITRLTNDVFEFNFQNKIEETEKKFIKILNEIDATRYY